MNSFACSGAAFRAVTVATTLAIALAMVSPATATQSPPVKVGGEVAVSTFETNTQSYPEAVRRPDGKWVVVWASLTQDGSNFGTYMQLYNADRTPLGGEVQVHTNTYKNQHVPRVDVAPDNSFVVTWYSAFQPSKPNVYFAQSQRFASNATKVGDEFTVNTGTGSAYYPDVAYLTNGNIAYCFHDTSSGTYRVMVRVYTPTFVPLSDAVEVHPDPQNSGQLWPRIAALTGGGFVIVYHENSAITTNYDILAQLYTNAGVKTGALLQLNTHTTGDQQNPQVAALPDGGFIVTWDSHELDGNGDGIAARRFAADGSPLSAEITVNTHTTGSQRYPAVATFSDNSFVVGWYGAWQSGDDIAIQYFDSSNNKVGTQILVNTHLSGTQSFPTIASNWEDGEFGVFYGSYDFKTASSGYDIAGQWFTADLQSAPTPVPPTPVPPTPVPPTPVPPTPVPPTPVPPTPVPDPTPDSPSCTSACLWYFCPEGKIIDIKVTGVVSNDVYGTSHFSDDSNVAAAAVYAGLVAEGEIATVTVRCSGPQPSFDSGTAHGVTTQAYGSSWPSSFTFDLAGATHAPPPPAPPRCFNEPCAVAKCNVPGTTFDIIVEGSVSNIIWGTEAFTDDSYVGTAAVHQGLLEAGSIGSVTVSCTGLRASLTGSTQNGVTSNSFGAYQYTYVLHAGPTAAPAPTDDLCVGACLERKCRGNEVRYLRVHGSTWGYLWGGNGPYTGDSTVSAAAVHAGLVSAGTTGIVKATCTGSQSSYSGSTQHGVTTKPYGPWYESFTLSSGADMPTVTCGPGERCLEKECTFASRVIKVSVTGSTDGATGLWGTTQYTGDSPVSHAAVHAGLVADGQTAVLYATCQGPLDAFTGSTANGITSSSYGPWGGSFTLSTP